MKTSANPWLRILTAVGLPLVLFGLTSPALAGNGNAAGYLVLQTNTCALSPSNPVCTFNFDLPSKAIVASGRDVLRFMLDGQGGTLNFQIHVNGHNVAHYSGGFDFVGVSKVVAASDFQISNDVVEFIVTGGSGTVNVSDTVLDFRLSTAP